MGSATQQAPETSGKFTLGDLALADPAVAQGIDQSQELVEGAGSFLAAAGAALWRGLAGQASYSTVGVWPNWRQFATGFDLRVERRGGVGSRGASGRLAAEGGKRVLHAVDEKLLDGPQ